MDRPYQGFPDFSDWGALTTPDKELWSRFTAFLGARRAEASPATLEEAVQIAIRAAALDTGAIEGLYSVDRGFTMTVAIQRIAWEQMIEERGANVRELFEAQLQAYELVIDAVTRRTPVSEAWIRALHERLVAPQNTYQVLTEVGWQEQELPRGLYKTRPNHVRLGDGSVYEYAPVDRVAEEMHRLIEQLRTLEFEAAHPALQASYAHYGLVAIHPFADGNGRVARALASFFYYRAQSIPLVIFAHQRMSYFDALQRADSGDSAPFIRFFLDRGVDTMQLVEETLRTSQPPRSQEIGRQEVTEPKLEHVIALRLYVEVERRLRVFLRELIVSPWAATGILEGFQVDVSDDSFSPFQFIFRRGEDPDTLEVRLKDVHPDLSASFELRLDQWIQRQLGRILRDRA